MADVKNIILDIQAKVGNANAQMAKFASEIDKAEKELSQLTKGTLAYAEAERKLLSLQRQLNAELGETEKVTSGLNGTLSKTRNVLLQFGAIAGIGLAFGDAVSTITQFDQALADLSAITGATGGDLEFLKNQAREFGRTTTVSASESVEAFKLIASAKPELLANTAALAETTRQAILLSEASGDDLPKAATNLTAALNQYNASADDAAKFTNVLAASAKFGSAEIPQVTDALLVFGATARSNNVTIEESAALIETLAEKGKVGAEAGTAIRNILLTLSAPEALPREARQELERFGISMDMLKDKSIPFADKLAALQPLIKDNAAAVNLFGKENVVAAQNLIENTDRIKQLTEQVTGTNAAQEAAEVRTNTLSGAFQKLKNSYEDFLLGASNSTGTFKEIIEFLAENLGTILSTLVTLGGVFVLYKGYTLAATVATNLFAKAQVNANGETIKQAGSLRKLSDDFKKAGGGIKGFGAALKGIPFNLILTGLTLIGGAIFDFISGLFEADFATKKLQEAQEDFNKELAKESAGLNTLFEQLKNTRAGTEERTEAIKQLQERYPEYIKGLNLENASLQEIEKAQAAANLQLQKNIALKLKQQKTEEIIASGQLRQLDLAKKFNKNIVDNANASTKFVEAFQKLKAEQLLQGLQGNEVGDEIFNRLFNDERFSKLTEQSKKLLIKKVTEIGGIDDLFALTALGDESNQRKQEKKAVKDITDFFDDIIGKAKPTGKTDTAPIVDAAIPDRLSKEQTDKIKKLAEDRRKLEEELANELRKEQRTGEDINVKNAIDAEIEKLEATKKLNEQRINEDLNLAIEAAKKEGILTDEAKRLFEEIRKQRLLNNEKEIQAQITKIQEDEEKKRLENEKNIRLTEVDENVQGINIDQRDLEQQKELLTKALAEATTASAKKTIKDEIQKINDLIESDILEKKDELIKKIDIQEEFDLKNAKSEEERTLISKKAAIERTQIEIDAQEQIDNLRDQEVAKDKERKKQLLEASQKLFDEVLNFADQLLQAQISRIDSLIDAQRERIDKAAQIAEKGNAELLEIEQRRLDELEKKREKAVRRQQALGLIELAVNSAIAISKAAAEGGAAAPITIAATLVALAAGIAQAISVANSTSFADGGYTGDGDRLSVSNKLGPRGYEYHKGEYVIPKHIVQIGKNKNILERIHRGRVDLSKEFDRQYYNVTNVGGGMDDEQVEKIVKAVKQIPATKFKLTKEGVFKMTQTVDEHNNRVKKRIS